MACVQQKDAASLLEDFLCVLPQKTMSGNTWGFEIRGGMRRRRRGRQKEVWWK